MSKTAERNEAKRLYVDEGMTGQEVAAKIGVSDTHLYRWARQYGWKAQRDDKLKEKKILLMGLAVKREDVLSDFKEFVSQLHPDLTIKIESLMNQFLQIK